MGCGSIRTFKGATTRKNQIHFDRLLNLLKNGDLCLMSATKDLHVPIITKSNLTCRGCGCTRERDIPDGT